MSSDLVPPRICQQRHLKQFDNPTFGKRKANVEGTCPYRVTPFLRVISTICIPIGSGFIFDLKFRVSLDDPVDFVLGLAVMDAREGFDVRASDINTSITLLYAFYEQPDFGLDQSSKAIMSFPGATGGDDTEIVFVIFCEESMSLEEIPPGFLARVNLINDFVCALKLAQHGPHGRLSDTVCRAHTGERRSDDRHQMGPVLWIQL